MWMKPKNHLQFYQWIILKWFKDDPGPFVRDTEIWNHNVEQSSLWSEAEFDNQIPFETNLQIYAEK